MLTGPNLFSQSLAYYFIRCLIHRPAVCFGGDDVKPPSMLALSSSSKHMVQIMQLLDERRLCLSLSVNKKELIFVAGLALLWQNLDMKRDSKIAQESQKLLKSVVDLLKAESAPAAAEFSVLVNSLMSSDSGIRGAITIKSSPSSEMLAPPLQQRFTEPDLQLQSWKAQMSVGLGSGQGSKHDAPSRRATVSGGSPHLHYTAAGLPKSPNRASLGLSQQGHLSASNLPSERSRSLSNSPDHHHSETDLLAARNPDPTTAASLTTSDWEYVVTDMDRGFSNIFTGIYGGKECGDDTGPFAAIKAEYEMKRAEAPLPLPPQQPDLHGVPPETWSATSSELPVNHGPATQSVFSYSEESMASADDSGAPLTDVLDPYRGIIMPATDDNLDNYGLNNGWRRLAV